MRDADVSHTALINKMADYLRNVLPDTKWQQSDFGKQTAINAHYIGPQRSAIRTQTSVANPSNSSTSDVIYETTPKQNFKTEE
jgi:hypothetical protein